MHAYIILYSVHHFHKQAQGMTNSKEHGLGRTYDHIKYNYGGSVHSRELLKACMCRYAFKNEEILYHQGVLK